MAQTISQKLVARLGADLSEFKKGLRSSVREAEGAGSKMKAGIGRATGAARMLVKTVALVSAALIGIGALAVREFVQWEKAMTGVAKTVDATDDQIRQLGQSFVKMSEQIPVSANELARLGEVAGQLGVDLPNIREFVETAAALGVSTNLMAEEAATGLARFSNVMGTAVSDVGRLGSVIVDLGNNLATTEREILEMSLRLTGAGKQVGLTEAQVLSFSAAMSSLGIRSEAGGTALSRVFAEIASSVATGGERLEEFAKVADLSVQDFQKAFREDAAEAVITFIAGLDRLSKAGENVFGVLEKVQFADIRVRDSLLRAAGGVDILRDALEIGNTAWAENTALTDEAERFYDRLGARLTQLGNKIRNVAAEIGEALSPIVESATEIMSGFLDQVRAAGPAIATFAEDAARKIPGMVETVVQGVGRIGLKILSVVEFFRDNPIAGGLGIVGLVFLGPLGAAALTVLGAAIDRLFDKIGGPQTVAAALQQNIDDAARAVRRLSNEMAFASPSAERVAEIVEEMTNLKGIIDQNRRTMQGLTREDFLEFGEGGVATFDLVTDALRRSLEAMAEFRLELSGGGEGAEDTLTTFGQMKQQLEFIPSLLEEAQTETKTLGKGLSGIASTITSGIGNAIGGIITGVQSAGDAFKRLASIIVRDVITALVRAAVLTKLLGSVADVAPTPTSFGGIFRSLLGFQTGGIVPGAGNAGRPILAHPGEVVLSKSAVASLGGAVQANQINQGAPPQTQAPVNVTLTVDASNMPEASDFGIIATNPQMIQFVSELFRQVEFVRG